MRILALVFPLLGACSGSLRGPVVTAAELADAGHVGEQTRQTGFLRRIGTVGAEQTPAGIDLAALSDEVRIERVDGSQVCFGVTTRTDGELDRPLGSWTFRIDRAPATVHELGVPSARAFPIVYDRTVVDAQSRHGSLQVVQPTDGTYRVVERNGTVCGTISTARPRTVELLMKIPGATPYEDWYQRYDWTLE